VSTVDGDEASFERLAEFVERELDFATSHYNDSYLKRRLASRMRRRNVPDYDDYRELLASEDDERTELLDALSINVTGFFRNPDVWEGVRSVLRTLSAEGSVDVWSAGCADGREPYSVSMLAADDPRVDADRVSVTGTDINQGALAAAREGVYHDSRTVDVGDQLEFLSNYHRHVDRDDDRYRVREGVRERVSFEHHDLINDDPKSGLDLVLCRNLFIYIDGEYKRPVLRTVRESLRPGGYLVIGKAETIPPSMREEFTTVDGRLRIYQCPIR
jgi:chemotaxis protein methyltransferase CheR